MKTLLHPSPLRPVLSAVAGLVLAFVPFSPAADKPNFVVFLVDDLGWGDMGCYGSTFHETPHIDRLASEGMRFTDAYSACTVCSPSRAALLTGRYPARLHLTDWITGHVKKNPKLLIPDWTMKMSPALTTLPEALGSYGYRSGFIGKWHLMPIGEDDFDQHTPTDHGFASNVGGREWGQPKGPGKYFSPFGMPHLDDGETGDYLTDALTDEAVQFIEGNKENPFLLYFSYYTVHTPVMARPEKIQRYKEKAEGFETERDESVRPEYAAMIESLDESVGRVLAKLEECGLAENTVVVFTSDNGGNFDNTDAGLRGFKAHGYEGGVRVPLAVRWPGKIAAGTVSAVPTIGTDLFPTFLEMAGAPQLPEAHLDGLSLAPVLTGKAPSLERDSLYWHYPHYHRTLPYGAVRHGDWKLIEYFEDGALELYNLAADPSESDNLAAAQPEKTAALHSDLRRWRESVGAQMPTPNPGFQ